MQTNQSKRVLAISLSSRGFGYACLEGRSRLVDYGSKAFYERFKNVWLLGKAAKLVQRNAPDILVLQDISAKDKARSKRVRELHRQLMALSKEQGIKMVKRSGKQVRLALLNDEQATKHELATHVAAVFPDELGSRLPPKRRSYDNEHPRMDYFDAAGLAVAFIKGSPNFYGEQN